MITPKYASKTSTSSMTEEFIARRRASQGGQRQGGSATCRTHREFGEHLEGEKAGTKRGGPTGENVEPAFRATRNRLTM
jgi:hypothetical protein